MNKTTFVRVATVVFVVVGLGHLYRALYALPVSFDGWAVPVELSWAVGLVALFLGYMGYKHWR